MDDRLYYIVGALVVGNTLTILTVLGACARGVWFMAKLHSDVEQNKKDTNAAHGLIREIQRDVQDIFKDSNS